MISALRRISGARVAVIDIAPHPTGPQVAELCRILDRESASMIVTINDWGIDYDGELSDFLESREIIQVNWYVDDPFYEEIMFRPKFRPSPLRFDFVSDKGYLTPMHERGYQARFLPLGTDLSVFHPDPTDNAGPQHDLVFVGNSYLRQMNEMLALAPSFADVLAPVLGPVIREYLADVSYDVEAAVTERIKKRMLPPELSYEKACYIAKHAAGYFGRKRLVTALARRYASFRVFGDAGWLQDLPPERLGTAKYYDTLPAVYRKSKIVVDINRIVIRNGFTQRPFDVLASGGFILTGTKPVTGDCFICEGTEAEIAVFRSEDDLCRRIDYYLEHDDERKAIASRGMKKVSQCHTYDRRIAEIFGTVSGSTSLKPRETSAVC